MSNRMSPTSTLSQNILNNNNNNHHAQSQPMQIINNSIQEKVTVSSSSSSPQLNSSTNNTTNSHHVAGFLSPTLISDYCHLMSLGNSSNSMDNNNNSSKTSAVDDAFTHMMDYSKNRVSSFLPLSEIMANDQESIRNETVSKILTEHDIDNLIRVMSFHPEFLKEFVEFYNFLMYGRYGALASDARHFIAMMAASRHRCIYLVEQQEREFLVHNGPKSWLRGLDHVPSKLKDLLELNKLLCHRPWAVNSSHIEKILKSSNSWTLNELITAVVIIIQFHALAGLAFGCGVNENYLQQLAVKHLEDRRDVTSSGKKAANGMAGVGQSGKVRSKRKGEAKEADYVLEEDDDDADLLVVERDELTTTTTTNDDDESDLDEDFYDDEDLYDENDKNNKIATMTTTTSELFGEKDVVRNVNESSSGNHSLEEADYESHHRLAGLNGSTSSAFQYTSQRTLSDSSASSCELGLDMLVKEMQLIKDQNDQSIGVGDKNNNSINIIAMSHHESPQTTITNNTPSSNNHSYRADEMLNGERGVGGVGYQLDHHFIHSKRKHKSDDSDSAQHSLDLKKPSPSSSLSPVKSTNSTSSRHHVTSEYDSSRFLNTASIREKKDLYMQRFTTDMSFGYIECEKDDESLKLEYYTWENQGYVTAYSIQPDMSDALDKTFKVAANMTYNTMGTFTDVDTSLFRRAIWHYIHMLFGVRYDDYDYKQIKLLLKSPLRKYIRIVCTCPDRVTRRHYDSIMREFRHSEKVHLNLVIMEARVQCALLYFLRSVNSFYGS